MSKDDYRLRVFAEMDRYIDAAEAEGLVLLHFRVAETLLADLSGPNGARLAYYRGVEVRGADEWSWGWMLLVRKPEFKTIMYWFQPSDSGSGSQSEDAPAAEAEGPQSGPAKTGHRPNSPPTQVT